MENKNFAHIEPQKEPLALIQLEAINSTEHFQKHWNQEQKPLKFEKGMSEKEFQNLIENVLPETKPHVATGRKLGREKKTPMESLKVQSHKIKLTAKRDEINFVESIVDKTRERSIPTNWNSAVMFLNPLGGNFIEESVLQENLRKIQGL